MRAAAPGIIAASRRRTVAPSAFGYNTKDTSGPSNMGAGRMYVSKFTLAAAATLNELHGWFGGPTAVNAQARVVIYAADGSGGLPGTRLAYTNIVTYSNDTELAQAGFSVALAAADYWIGFSCIATGTGGGPACYAAATGSTHQGLLSGAADPPPTPFGTPNTSGTRKHCVWGIVT